MATFEVGDRVEVRATSALPWQAGAVAAVDEGPAADCYQVTLDTPITADDWSGLTRKYAGSETLTAVWVHYHTESLTPDEHIKAEGA